MSIEATIEQDSATYVVRPEYGRPVTFAVEKREINVSQKRSWYTPSRMAERYVVGLAGSDGLGFSHHVSFEEACRRALSRARRYDKAYSVPRMVPETRREWRVA